MYYTTWTHEEEGRLIEDVEIAIDFDFDRGQKPIIYGDPDRCQEGIRPSATITFAKRLDTGDEIPLALFTKEQIGRWEEDILIEKMDEYE